MLNLQSDFGLFTTRKYPCGCAASGPGDIPAYCPDHDRPSPKKPWLLRFLAVPVLLALSCVGCSQSAYTTATKFQVVIAGILNIVQADVPALPAADQPIASQWLATGQTLDTQLASCITAGGTNGNVATFGACFNVFAAGLTSPAELAQLRILSPASQAKVELWATAAILAVNGALTIYQLATHPQPQIAADPPSHHDLVALAHRVGVPAYGL
jgi:hypothetical protein